MEQLLIGLWLLCGVLVFAPIGKVSRLVGGRLIRSRGVAGLAGVVGSGPDETSAGVGAAPPSRDVPARQGRLSGKLIPVALYTVFVVGAIYYTPPFLSRVLDTPYPLAAVTSSSMWPTLHKGDLVVLQGVDSVDDLRVGDIIAFRHQDGFAIHRVVKIEGDVITTRGDANSLDDRPIAIEDVVGRVAKLAGRLVRIPYLGNLPLLMNRTAEVPHPEGHPVFEGQPEGPGTTVR